MKNTETDLGANRKVAFILGQRRGENSRLMPQELCLPLREESRGLNKARAHGQELVMEQR